MAKFFRDLREKMSSKAQRKAHAIAEKHNKDTSLNRPLVVHMDIRKLKPEPETNLPAVSTEKLQELIEEAVVDAYNEEEQRVGFLTMIQEHLTLPFSTKVLGIEVVVEKIDMTRDGQIVAVCRREKDRQRIGILDLPLPVPAPRGAEWVTAYSHWRKGY